MFPRTYFGSDYFSRAYFPSAEDTPGSVNGKYWSSVYFSDSYFGGKYFDKDVVTRVPSTEAGNPITMFGL